MLWILDRRIGGLELSKSVGPILKMAVAAVVMTAACIGVQRVPGFPLGVC
jgi:hypothetical protein